MQPALMTQSSSDFVLLGTPQGEAPRCSNNRGARDFVMVHESPVTHRRALRASKELSTEDQQKLSALVVAVAELNDSGSECETAMGTSTRHEGDEDESGCTVLPSPTLAAKKGSFKFGRRISTEQPSSPTVKAGQGGQVPESPTAVDSFFGGSLGNSASKLLGPLGK